LAAGLLFSIRKRAVPHCADLHFAIPLPARVKFPVHEPVYGIVDNITPAGFRFHGRFPEYAQFGANVTGELHLPGGAMPFEGTVRSFYLGQSGKGERFAKSVGLSFDRVGVHQDGNLEPPLCESALQGRITELLDRGTTPIRLLERLFRRGSAQLPSRADQWTPVLIHASREARNDPEVGMIAMSAERGAPRMVLTFAPIVGDTRIQLRVLSRAARQPLEGAVNAPRIFDTPLAPIYAYQFIGSTRAKA
jgi:hypothetical protein